MANEGVCKINKKIFILSYFDEKLRSYVMKKYFLAAVLAALYASAFAQSSPVPGKWWVEFTDKDLSPYCTCRPYEFLSARSLERRARAGIAVQLNDLPVNPSYTEALRKKGAQLHLTSRWLNAAAVVADSATAFSLQGLPFVKNVTYVGKHLRVKNPPNKAPKSRESLKKVPQIAGSSSVFGYASKQNSLLGLPTLHFAGHRGKDIWIAVMDGGFNLTDTMPFFDSVALQHRLYQGWDFVERDKAVFESAMHGTSVLSLMAANLPGYFVGTAPDATYFLIKTEDTGGEFPIEEANWIAGAEWADSVGVDVLTASLGYTVFNDTTLGHRTWELDGRTAIGSRGAAIAATKGMIVLNSAGNEGDNAWRTIGVPADATGVLAVGAVTSTSTRAGFSSLGPTRDGRIKPDLMAPGDMVVTAGNYGTELGLSSGTSLAAPMLAGGMASLWSAFPEKTAEEIINAVFASADQNDRPDNERGFGLPDLTRAWLTMGGFYTDAPNDAREGLFAYDRTKGQLDLLLYEGVFTSQNRYELVDVLGNVHLPASVQVRNNRLVQVSLSGLETLPPGMFRVRITDPEGVVYNFLSMVWY